MYRTGGRKILSNLLNWFTFDNKVGSTFNDVGGVTVPLQTATLVSGATTDTGVDKVFSGAIWFSGISATQGYNISGHISLTAPSTAMLGQQGTICAWIKRRASKDNVVYDYGMQTGTLPDQYYITVGIDTNDRLGYTYRGAVPLVISGTTSTADLDTWTHVAVTSDGSKIRLYVNGVLESSTAAGTNSGQWFGDIATSGTWARYIGASVHSGIFINHFDGKIDNFRLANFPMTETQLKELYESKM